MKNILIYGANSKISLELLSIISNDSNRIILFARNANELKKNLKKYKIKKKITIYACDLLDLKKNLSLISKIKFKINGIFWFAGYTGNANLEFKIDEALKKNIFINFLHPILILNRLTKKIEKNGQSFIVYFTSVAGLRGRSKNIFYGSAKSASITYLSGLRQRFNDKIKVITVIPGYMKTKPFKIKTFDFLVSKPRYVALRILKAIKQNEEIVYINWLWRLIMTLVKLIPEKIFKKLKF